MIDPYGDALYHTVRQFTMISLITGNLFWRKGCQSWQIL